MINKFASTKFHYNSWSLSSVLNTSFFLKKLSSRLFAWLCEALIRILFLFLFLLVRQSHSELKIKYKQPLQLFKNSYKQHSLVCHVSPVVHEAWHERLKWHQSRNFQHIKSLKCWSQGLQIHLAFLPWWLLGLGDETTGLMVRPW